MLLGIGRLAVTAVFMLAIAFSNGGAAMAQSMAQGTNATQPADSGDDIHLAAAHIGELIGQLVVWLGLPTLIIILIVRGRRRQEDRPGLSASHQQVPHEQSAYQQNIYRSAPHASGYPSGFRPPSPPRKPSAGLWLAAVVAGLFLLGSCAFIVGKVVGDSAPEPSPPPAGWVVTIDGPTGISLALPTATLPTEERDGDLTFRLYAARQPNGGILFQVSGDLPAASDDTKQGALDETMNFANHFGSDGHVTSSQHLMVGEYPALDVRVAGTVNGQDAFAICRFIATDHNIVGVTTSGLISDESNLTTVHQLVLSTMRLS